MRYIAEDKNQYTYTQEEMENFKPINTPPTEELRHRLEELGLLRELHQQD